MVTRPDPGVVYRQVISGGEPIWFNPSREPPVSHAAFLPSREDADGLSLIDSSTRSEVWAAHRMESPKTQRHVAVLDVSMIAEVATEVCLSHELVCDPDKLDKWFGEPSSHWLATRINRCDYDSNKDVKKR